MVWKVIKEDTIGNQKTGEEIFFRYDSAIFKRIKNEGVNTSAFCVEATTRYPKAVVVWLDNNEKVTIIAPEIIEKSDVVEKE